MHSIPLSSKAVYSPKQWILIPFNLPEHFFLPADFNQTHSTAFDWKITKITTEIHLFRFICTFNSLSALQWHFLRMQAEWKVKANQNKQQNEIKSAEQILSHIHKQSHLIAKLLSKRAIQISVWTLDFERWFGVSVKQCETHTHTQTNRRREREWERTNTEFKWIKNEDKL